VITVYYEENIFFVSIIHMLFFYSGMGASHPEIYLSYTAIIPAAPQETVGDAGIEPGTAA
jgi:hypothetical protein